MAPAQKRQHATPNLLAKEILWAEHARSDGRNSATTSKLEAAGGAPCTQIPRQTTCCKKKAPMYLRERAQKDVHVSSKPSKDLKASVLRNERATPRDPALSSDSAVRRANLEAAGGAL